MPDITRDCARALRAPADGEPISPGAPLTFEQTIVEIAQAPPAPALSPPQNCPTGTAPNSTSMAAGASVSVLGVQASGGFAFGTANCAPMGGTSPGSSAPGAGGSAPSGSGQGGAGTPDSPLTGYP